MFVKNNYMKDECLRTMKGYNMNIRSNKKFFMQGP